MLITTDIQQLTLEIEQFQAAILELEERYRWLAEQPPMEGMPVPWEGRPEEILRAAMVQAELNADREVEKAGIRQAIALMATILQRKQAELASHTHAYN